MATKKAISSHSLNIPLGGCSDNVISFPSLHFWPVSVSNLLMAMEKGCCREDYFSLFLY